jgi:hypothetical protein
MPDLNYSGRSEEEEDEKYDDDDEDFDSDFQFDGPVSNLANVVHLPIYNKLKHAQYIDYP